MGCLFLDSDVAWMIWHRSSVTGSIDNREAQSRERKRPTDSEGMRGAVNTRFMARAICAFCLFLQSRERERPTNSKGMKGAVNTRSRARAICSSCKGNNCPAESDGR